MNREILGQTYWIYMTLPGSRQDDDDGYPLAAIKIAAKTLAAILVVGTRETSETQYTRVLRLDIVDKQSFVEGSIKKLCEGKVVSRGFSDQLVKVLPEMVKALFEDFPGQSGSTTTSSQVTDSATVFGNFL
jgi:hypothetical protein